jgi:hypothetical protein
VIFNKCSINKDVVNSEKKLPRSGFVHSSYITGENSVIFVPIQDCILSYDMKTWPFMWIGPGKPIITMNCRFVQQTENIMVQVFGGYESAIYILQKD